MHRKALNEGSTAPYAVEKQAINDMKQRSRREWVNLLAGSCTAFAATGFVLVAGLST